MLPTLLYDEAKRSHLCTLLGELAITSKSYIMNNYYDLLDSEELYKAIYVSSKSLSFFFQAALLLKTHAICGKGT